MRKFSFDWYLKFELEPDIQLMNPISVHLNYSEDFRHAIIHLTFTQYPTEYWILRSVKIPKSFKFQILPNSYAIFDQTKIYNSNWDVVFYVENIWF